MTRQVRQALYAKITGASGITNLLASSSSVYHAVAPPQAAYPVVIFHRQSSRKFIETFADKTGRNTLWLVKGVTTSSSSNLADDIADAIQTALDDSTLTITGGSLYRMSWESGVEFTELEDGEQIRHSGGLYRITYRTP